MENFRIYKRGDTWVFDDYFRYLERCRNLIPDHIAKFVCDRDRYLDGEKSLCGAMLVSLDHSLDDDSAVAEFQMRTGSRVTFRFGGVIMLKRHYLSETMHCNKLLMHQFRILAQQFFRYEFLSATGDRIVVDFSTLKIEIQKPSLF